MSPGRKQKRFASRGWFWYARTSLHRKDPWYQKRKRTSRRTWKYARPIEPRVILRVPGIDDSGLTRSAVRRVRKEPAPIVASIEASAASGARSRPPKRALASAPPRADHKRRKVLDTQVPVQLEPEATSASTSNPGRGREILSAPEFKQNAKSGPSIVTPGRIAIKLPAPKTALGGKSGAQITRPDAIVLLSGRLTDTEKRLDAMETRLQKGMHSQTLINRAHEYVQPNLDLPRASMSSQSSMAPLKSSKAMATSKAQRAACGRCTRLSLTKMWVSSPPAVVGTRVMGYSSTTRTRKALRLRATKARYPTTLKEKLHSAMVVPSWSTTPLSRLSSRTA